MVEWSGIVVAGLLYAIALKYFVLPSRVILTGTEGIAAALSYYFDSRHLFIVLYLVFQACLLVFAWMRVSRTFAIRSAAVVGIVVAGLSFLPTLQFAQDGERLLLVIFGGLIAGFAKAAAFKNRGSTGDEDVLAAFFAMKYLKPVGVIAIIAASVSTVFGLTLDVVKHGHFETAINTLMYTSVYIFASAETLNNLYHKFKLTMLVVITRQGPAVGAAIRTCSEHRTYTVQQGVGGHSQTPFEMVRTIVTREELPEIIPAVEAADPQCFYFHQDVEGASRRFYIKPIG